MDYFLIMVKEFLQDLMVLEGDIQNEIKMGKLRAEIELTSRNEVESPKNKSHSICL